MCFLMIYERTYHIVRFYADAASSLCGQMTLLHRSISFIYTMEIHPWYCVQLRCCLGKLAKIIVER